MSVREWLHDRRGAPVSEEALARVIALHSQTSDIGLAPGKWCPECGKEEPCPTLRAALAPPAYLGHISREELRQRAMDYDEDEETALRQRESAALTHNPTEGESTMSEGITIPLRGADLELTPNDQDDEDGYLTLSDVAADIHLTLRRDLFDRLAEVGDVVAIFRAPDHAETDRGQG